MYKYEVGQVIEGYKNRPEGVHFDISDSGAIMLVLFRSPTTKEMEQFKSANGFEIRFVELGGIIMITTKIGNLNWMDAPYTPHLSNNLTKIDMPSNGQGLSLTLILVDAATGEIKHLRMLGLSERFTRRLLGITMEHMTKDFDLSEYNNLIKDIFSKYTTNQIVSMSSDYCKVRS